MKHAAVSFLVGLIFALGLGISGMTQPQKVIGFLDLTGAWDPSLIFVMAGAVGLHFLTYRLVRKKQTPLLDKIWHVPTSKEITPQLVVGSMMFGIGWGLAGYCPGPALTSLAGLNSRTLIFVASMVAGMIVFKLVEKQLMAKRK